MFNTQFNTRVTFTPDSVNVHTNKPIVKQLQTVSFQQLTNFRWMPVCLVAHLGEQNQIKPQKHKSYSIKTNDSKQTSYRRVRVATAQQRSVFGTQTTDELD